MIYKCAVYLRSLMKTKKLYILFSIILISASSDLLAQLDNSGLFYQNQNLENKKAGDLDLGIYALGFNKNNEYYERTATGYTLFGYLFRPELSYIPIENFSIKMGLLARKDFGNENYTLFQPTFSLQYKYERFRFLFGNIEGPLEHNYIEPIYDFERIVTNNPENGLQIFYDSDFLHSDAWISWNKMIYDRSPYREEFNGGVNLELKPLREDRFYVSIPLQSIATHVGGQIDDDPKPARTVSNFAAGIIIGSKFKDGFFKKVELKSYMSNYYSLESKSLIPPFRDGLAYYLNALISTQLGDVMLSYWNGDEYSSWNGGHLYQSTSKNWREPFALQPQREIIIIRLLNDIKLREDLRILPRFEPYWNLQNGKFGFSMGLYIKFQDYFHLKNINAKN